MDDGWSGTHFNRPAFQEMLKDAKAGRIDLILVKDLSRLGRSHIEVDHYVEEVFPDWGVRFIALMDGIDSEGSADILPFRSLLNDYYLKDLSRKVKSVLHAKAEAGDFVGGTAPYGYKKDPERHGRLIVDPYAAAVVRRVFDLRLQRMGYAKIAAVLNADGIGAPRAYYYWREGKPNPYGGTGVWQQRTVKLLLQNEVYLGHSVKMKKRRISYKTKKQIARPEKEWIRVLNTHEAVIDQDLWDAVQGVNLKGYRLDTSKIRVPSLFTGLAECGNGHGLCCNTGTKRKQGKIKKYRSYYCPLHRQTGGTLCSWHTISENTLLRIIRADISGQINATTIEPYDFVSEIQNRLTEMSLGAAKKELQRLSSAINDLKRYAAKLYEDRLDGNIKLDTFISLSAGIDKEYSEKKSAHNCLSKTIEAAEKCIYAINESELITRIRGYLSMEKLDRDSLHELIDKIVIGEGEGISHGIGRRQSVTVYYRFTGLNAVDG